MHFLHPTLIALCYLAVSCAPPEYLSEKELAQYVIDNDNLSKSVSADQIEVKAIFRPTDLLVAQELEPTTLDKVSIKRARARYANHYYFILSFSSGGKG